MNRRRSRALIGRAAIGWNSGGPKCLLIGCSWDHHPHFADRLTQVYLGPWLLSITTKRTACTKDGHEHYAARNCAGCRSEAIAEPDQEAS